MRSAFGLVALLAVVVAACSPEDAKTSGPIGFAGARAGSAGVAGPPVIGQPNQPGVSSGGNGASGAAQPGGNVNPPGTAGSTPIGPATPPAGAGGSGPGAGPA